MADLERRPSYSPRRAREARAYRLVVAGGTAGVVAVAGLVLSIAGIVGAWLPILALLVALACALSFRRVIQGR